MDFFTTMFKPRPSQSPARQIKRPSDNSPPNPPKVQKTSNGTQATDEPGFTFEEVELMTEKLLESIANKRLLVSQGLKAVDFSQIVIPGHSPEQCKNLLIELIKRVRRTKTLHEVVGELKANLKRRTFTEIIQRSSLDKDEVPKRPPSAYFLYHADRYEDVKAVNPVAAQVSKLVSQEWKNLSERKRREYQKRHNDLMRAYEEKMERLGLIDDVEPKRPGTGRTLYIQERMETIDTNELTKEETKELKKQLGNEYDSLDKDEKKPWIELAKERFDQYREEHKVFSESHPHLKPKSVNIVRPGAKGNRNASGVHQRAFRADLPRPPRTPLTLYLEKKMPEGVEGEKAEELKRQLRDKFQQLSPRKQLKFIKKAVRDKTRYEQEIDALSAEDPELAQRLKSKEIKANLTKEQWKIYYSLFENRPTIPAPTTYLYYCGKKLSDDTYSSEIDPTMRMQYASQAWRSLSEKERSEIEQEHMDSVAKYIDDMTIWLENIDPERKQQILMKEPRSNPDYWRKRLNKSRKVAAKAIKLQSSD